jgi:hypothetical protein
MNRWLLVFAALAWVHGSSPVSQASGSSCGDGGCDTSGYAAYQDHGPFPFAPQPCGPHFGGPLGPAPQYCGPYCEQEPEICAPRPVHIYEGTYRGTFPHDPIPFLWDFSYKPYHFAYYPHRSDYAVSHGALPAPPPEKGKKKGGTGAERVPPPKESKGGGGAEEKPKDL